jgi:hypothetical protein
MANTGARKQTERRKAQSERAALLLAGLFGFLGVVIISPPTIMVLFIGMLPSMVAAIIDRSDERYFAYSVAAFNFCGVFPFILELWLGPHTIAAATDTITDVFTLVIMYGAAAFGWVVYQTVPPVIAQVLASLAQRRINTLRAQQRKIVEEWGPGVSGEPEDETASTDQATADADDEDGDDLPMPPQAAKQAAA